MTKLLRIIIFLVFPVFLSAKEARWQPAVPDSKLPAAFRMVRAGSSEIVVELNRDEIDFSSNAEISIAAAKVSGLAFCSGGDAATPLQFREKNGRFTALLPRDDSCYAVSLTAKVLTEIILDYTPCSSFKPINIAPAINLPAGKPYEVTQVCRKQGDQIIVDTGRIKAVFNTAGVLRLTSVFSADLDRQILRFPKQTELFRLKLDNGKTLNSSSAKIKSLKITDNGFTAELLCPENIYAAFNCSKVDETIAFSLSLTAGKTIAVKTAFPQIDGLSLSDNDNDYYCFPWGGGVIGDRSAYLRSIYGENDAWWQMLDLFSPANGGGFFLHVKDTTGLAKAFSMRKGRTPPKGSIIRPPSVAARNDLSLYFYQRQMPDGHGSGMAVDYQRITLRPGQNYTFPVTVIGSHAGNWKSPMKKYASWAKSVWKFRPYPGKLSDKFNYLAGFGCEGCLYTVPSWDNEAFVPKNDICEINGWWTASPLAPWNTEWEDFDQLGPQAARERKNNFGFAIDPFTHKPFYVFNRGDYDGYNPQWGGLPRFREQIKEVRRNNKISLLYTDPVIVCGNSRYGKSEAADHAVINPAWKDPKQCPKTPKVPAGVVCNYYSYCMCLNDAEYLQKVAADIKRIVEETGADGVRLDEYGHRGYVCLSKKHKHIFGEHGQHVWLQALERSLKLIRDAVPPETLILAEFPQADFAAAHLDGALSYDICRRQSHLRPLQVNLFRFYFPECRLFELNVGGPKNAKDIMLFNGDGVYNSGGRYSEQYSRILKENAACFIGDIEPLVDTLAPLVYANRFAAADGSKVLYTLYNDTGKKFSGAVLPVQPGYECIQLLPATDRTDTDTGKVKITLNPKQIGVILMIRKQK